MGMKIEDIHELIRLVDEADLAEVEIEHEGTKVVLKKVAEKAAALPATTVAMHAPMAPQMMQPMQPMQAMPTAAPQAETSSIPSPTEDPTLHKIVSPMVGTFYRSPSPDADPYVSEGDHINASTVVCIVEAMKLMNEIEAEATGTIVEVLVENGQLVEYGQPLFLVKTT